MTPEEAKQLCIQAHKGQFRRPAVMSYRDVAKFLNINTVPNKHEQDFEDGSILRWEDLCEHWEYSIPYSSHPIAVAEMMTTDDEKIVAYLHDVLEDTDMSLEFIVPYKLLNSIRWLTKDVNISYQEYLGYISLNKIATKVKIADMFHNISCNPTDKQKAKYFSGLKYLLNTL